MLNVCITGPKDKERTVNVGVEITLFYRYMFEKVSLKYF